MECSLVFVVSIFLLSYRAVHALECPDNEIVAKCPTDCPYDECPTKPGLPKNCPTTKSDICRASACKCRFNYSRSNGTCIPTRDCPPFKCTGPNEEYNACPPSCPTDDCSEASPTGKCLKVGQNLMVVPCRPDCRCKKNYWRKNGICVPYAQCKSDSQCGPNESLKKGIDSTSDCCPEDECQPSTCPDACATACKCNPNYRRASNGTCIPARECPAIPCPENEQFESCPVCSEECSNAVPDGRRCRYLGHVGTTVECDPKCRCIDNYWRNKDGDCVSYDECPESQCGPNETLKDGIDCTSDCCPEDKSQPSTCPDACATACKCNFNYRRASNGTCIPVRECPAIPCPENEQFESCPVCSEECSNAVPDGRRCRYVGNVLFTVSCDPKCRCIDNYWRNEDNVCVCYDECPNKTCSGNEEVATS